MSITKILLVTPLALFVLYMLIFLISIKIFNANADSKTIFSGSCMFAVVIWLAIIGLFIIQLKKYHHKINYFKYMYTSKEFSKWLKDNGCELESGYYRRETDGAIVIGNPKNLSTRYPAYDILNDICIRYAKEFWGSDDWHKKNLGSHITEIAYQLLNNNQKGAEKYIKNTCIFRKDVV